MLEIYDDGRYSVLGNAMYLRIFYTYTEGTRVNDDDKVENSCYVNCATIKRMPEDLVLV